MLFSSLLRYPVRSGTWRGEVAWGGQWTSGRRAEGRRQDGGGGGQAGRRAEEEDRRAGLLEAARR